MDNYTGKRLDGRYEIQEVIGVGGMAVVYKAYDSIDDRIVSVKILKDEYLKNEEFLRRFKNESKAISILSHPNIVKVYNVNYGDRLQYIVMEYIEGITLKEYIEQQGRLGIKETIHFTVQILRALQHAHDKGIIHRDIKPQNILLLSNGTIKVTDFGIARLTASDTKTMTDSAIGSVHYISPEQARGSKIDERTDIYSVGVVMYEMLTGKLPFVSENSVSVALMQLQEDPVSIREINPNIPEGLEQIVNKAMAKNPRERYQAASSMLYDIEEFKRNPSVRFRRDYHVDSDPTRFRTGSEPVVPEIPRAEPSHTKAEVIPADEDEGGGKSKVGFIVIGALIGLLVVGLVAFAALYFFTDLFNKETITVPSFIGLDYDTEVDGNPEYQDFLIEVVRNSDSRLTDGMVYDQDPPANRKVSAANKKVILYVVDNNEPIPVPDVSGMMWEAAQTMLENKGFAVALLPTVSATLEYGTVIKTSPAGNTQASPGSTVTIYYASDEDLITVPKVVGWDVNTAKEKLESMRLSIDPNYEEKASDLPKGEIISQNPAEGDKVIEGTRISVVVSTGVPEKVTATIKISLPSNDTRQSFDVYVNNENVQSKNLIMDGSSYQFTVEGSDPAATVKVYIDNREYYSCTVDFTQNPANVSEGHYAFGASASGSAVLPDVTGYNILEAKDRLGEKGFKNIEVKYTETLNRSQDGVVISQSPEGSNSSSIVGFISNAIPTNTRVTLTVAQYIGV